MICEVRVRDTWKNCEVIAHFKQRAEMVAAFTYDYSNGGGKCLDSKISSCFRPLRTEEDKAVEDILSVSMPGTGAITDYQARQLYRAGYRKQEEQK
jgi:hypothetical protein